MSVQRRSTNFIPTAHDIREDRTECLFYSDQLNPRVILDAAGAARTAGPSRSTIRAPEMWPPPSPPFFLSTAASNKPQTIMKYPPVFANSYPQHPSIPWWANSRTRNCSSAAPAVKGFPFPWTNRRKVSYWFTQKKKKSLYILLRH